MQNEWKRVIRELPVGEHRLRWEFETWSSLKDLFLAGVDIADAQFLANLVNLEKLNLQMIPITNIEPLGPLNELKVLSLIDIPVENIDVLSTLSGLDELWENSVLIT